MIPADNGGHPQAGPSSSKGPPGVKITSITATPVNANEIDLHWVATGNPYGYTVDRDGKYLNQIEGTSYQDTGLKPRKTYTYQVNIQDTSGNYTLGPRTTATTPKPPPLSKARLAGSFDVRFTFLSENYTNTKPGDKFGEKWRFKPKCASGPCSVTLVMGRAG
jgi:hypothetical protein